MGVFIEALSRRNYGRCGARLAGEVFEADAPDAKAFCDFGVARLSDLKEPRVPEKEALEPEEAPAIRQGIPAREERAAARDAAREKAEHDKLVHDIINTFKYLSGSQVIDFERENRARIPEWPEEAQKEFLRKWENKVGTPSYRIGEGPVVDDEAA